MAGCAKNGIGKSKKVIFDLYAEKKILGKITFKIFYKDKKVLVFRNREKKFPLIFYLFTLYPFL